MRYLGTDGTRLWAWLLLLTVRAFHPVHFDLGAGRFDLWLDKAQMHLWDSTVTLEPYTVTPES